MEILKSIDFLGDEPQTYIFKMTRYKTYFGGFMSMSAILIIISLSLYFSIEVFSRTHLNLISSQTTTFTKSLQFGDIPVLFLAANINGVAYNTSVIYPVFQMWNFYAENNGSPTVINAPYRQCESDDLKGYEASFTGFKNLQQYMCLDKKISNLTLFGEYGDIVKGYSRLQVYVAKCTNNSALNPNADKQNCMSDSQIDTILGRNPVHIYIVYPDNNIDFKDTANTFNTYLKTEDFIFPLLALNRYLYYIKRTFVQSDYGFVFEDFSEISSYQYDRTESSLFIGSSFVVKEAIGLITFSLSQKADLHIRSYNKLQSLMANIGGFVNFIYIVARLIVHYISSKSLLLKYVNYRLTEPGIINEKLNSKLTNTKADDITSKTNASFKLVGFRNQQIIQQSR
jgi:hypothetical protein